MSFKPALLVFAIAPALLNVLNTSSSSFKYKFVITANSFHPVDEINLYYYKEQLIDQYEKLVFGLDQKTYEEVIRINIHTFAFDSNCTPSYYEGKIKLIIGKGKGKTIEGVLRKDECDSSVIREKIYIFDLFK